MDEQVSAKANGNEFCKEVCNIYVYTHSTIYMHRFVVLLQNASKDANRTETAFSWVEVKN